jgi:hypothetical protein
MIIKKNKMLNKMHEKKIRMQKKLKKVHEKGKNK